MSHLKDASNSILAWALRQNPLRKLTTLLQAPAGFKGAYF